MPSVSERQHKYFQYKLHAKDSTEKEKEVAKEFLDADKATGKYQESNNKYVVCLIKDGGDLYMLFTGTTWTLPIWSLNSDENANEVLKKKCNQYLNIDVTDQHDMKTITLKNGEYIIHTVTKYTGKITNLESKRYSMGKFQTRHQLTLYKGINKLNTITKTLLSDITT